MKNKIKKCNIVPKVSYLKVKELLQQQRAAILERIKDYSNSHVVRKGLNFQAGKPIPIQDIPGICMNFFFFFFIK